MTVLRRPIRMSLRRSAQFVGWSGAQRYAIYPEGPPGWLVAGLTVVQDQRRRGIAARLLDGVVRAVQELEPDEAVFSVTNARNPPVFDEETGQGRLT